MRNPSCIVRPATAFSLAIGAASAFSPRPFRIRCSGFSCSRAWKRLLAFPWQSHTNAINAALVNHNHRIQSCLPDLVGRHASHVLDTAAISDLCSLLNVEARAVLRNNEAGIRGMYPEVSEQSDGFITEGEMLLSIPLSSCIRDDMPPEWWLCDNEEDDKVDTSTDYYSSQWATRLAASLIDLKLQSNDTSTASTDGDTSLGMKLWLSLLPKANVLRASLPIHWSTDILQSARCQALELGVDSAYFARANAVMDLMGGLKELIGGLNLLAADLNEGDLSALCNDALDIVQTRTCRVMTEDNTVPLRLLAPVFDFLNHGTNPNAGFQLESDLLVVRAKRDIEQSEEILIDYGESSTAPSWRCLTSYGFVPNYDEADERNSVELFVDGARSGVGGDSVPFELVEAAAKYLRKGDGRSLEEGANIFTPAVALRIADRATEEAEKLLKESRDLKLATDEEKYSLSLATDLRLAEHKVLTAWSSRLREYAISQQ